MGHRWHRRVFVGVRAIFTKHGCLSARDHDRPSTSGALVRVRERPELTGDVCPAKGVLAELQAPVPKNHHGIPLTAGLI